MKLYALCERKVPRRFFWEEAAAQESAREHVDGLVTAAGLADTGPLGEAAVAKLRKPWSVQAYDVPEPEGYDAIMAQCKRAAREKAAARR